MSEDILERAKQIEFDHIAYRKTDCESQEWVKTSAFWYDEMVECIPQLIAEIEAGRAEVERLRSEIARINKHRESDLDRAGIAERIYLDSARAKDARIEELEAELRKTIAARDEWIAIANQERLVRDRLEAQVDQSRTEIVGRIQECQGCMAHGESAYMQRLEAAFLKSEEARLHHELPIPLVCEKKRIAREELERIKGG